MSDDRVINLIIGFIIGVVIGGLFAINITNSMWKEQSVRKGYGEYSKTTGEWQWIQ